MNTYIVLLKAINVAGKRMIKMDQLRTALHTIGFLNVDTYLQSGNIIINTKESDVNQIKEKITNVLQEEFGIETAILIYSLDELADIVRHNPLKNQQPENLSFYHVSLLEIPEDHYNQDEIIAKKDDSEEVHCSEKAIYLYCPNGYGKTKLNNNFLEKKLKMNLTTRNWKTTLELYQIAQDLAKL